MNHQLQSLTPEEFTSFADNLTVIVSFYYNDYSKANSQVERESFEYQDMEQLYERISKRPFRLSDTPYVNLPETNQSFKIQYRNGK